MKIPRYCYSSRLRQQRRRYNYSSVCAPSETGLINELRMSYMYIHVHNTCPCVTLVNDVLWRKRQLQMPLSIREWFSLTALSDVIEPLRFI